MQLFLKVLCILQMQRKAYHTICEQLQTKDKSYMLNRLLVQRELGGMLTFAIQTFDKSRSKNKYSFLNLKSSL